MERENPNSLQEILVTEMIFDPNLVLTLSEQSRIGPMTEWFVDFWHNNYTPLCFYEGDAVHKNVEDVCRNLNPKYSQMRERAAESDGFIRLWKTGDVSVEADLATILNAERIEECQDAIIRIASAQMLVYAETKSEEELDTIRAWTGLLTRSLWYMVLGKMNRLYTDCYDFQRERLTERELLLFQERFVLRAMKIADVGCWIRDQQLRTERMSLRRWE